MSFEQYQFMRYYLPGSLFLVYLALLLSPFSGPRLVEFMKSNFGGLVTLVLGVFVVSPAVGYVLYIWYDTNVYNKKFMDWSPGQRPSLGLLVACALKGELPSTRAKKPDQLTTIEGSKECQDKLRPATKGLIDFIIHTEVGEKQSAVKSRAAGNLPSYWSNYAARYICSRIAPLSSMLVFFAIIIIDNLSILPFVSKYEFMTGTIFALNYSNPIVQLTWLVFSLSIILSTSLVLWRGEKRPREEAFQLEYYIVRTKLAGAGRNGLFKEALSYFKGKVEKIVEEEEEKKSKKEGKPEGEKEKAQKPKSITGKK
jgi:hypothetical protein